MTLAECLCQAAEGVSAKALRQRVPSLIRDQQGRPRVRGGTSQGKGGNTEVRGAVEKWVHGGLGVE